MMCIEPYPKSGLHKMAQEHGIEVRQEEVQRLSLDFFDQLEVNDILFIDSSHVCKLDSDVTFLYLEVLPRLRPGVIIHAHDIMFPYLTSPPWHPILPMTMLWNETTLLQALLINNPRIEILMCQSYLHHSMPAAIKALIESYEPTHDYPSSIWMVTK
jgi:hypothetical protein